MTPMRRMPGHTEMIVIREYRGMVRMGYTRAAGPPRTGAWTPHAIATPVDTVSRRVAHPSHGRTIWSATTITR